MCSMTVASVAVFLLVLFAANKATPTPPYSCNSDVELSASGNGMDTTDLLEAATLLQYCMVDNCTIMRIDTGEELEIIRIIRNLIVAIPTDGHTSSIVLKLENKVPCLIAKSNTNVLLAVGGQMIASLLHGFISVYIVTVHLLFAELRTVFGKLLIGQNISLFLLQIFAIIAIMAHYLIALGSQAMCQAILNSIMLLSVTFECYSTCILFHITMVMYYSYKCRSKSDLPENLSLFYNCFVFGLFSILVIAIIGYDLYSGNGKQAISANGHCALYHQYSYQTVRFSKPLQ